MKRSDVFRRAAKLMEDKPNTWAACGAIRRVLGTHGEPVEPEVLAFADLFQPSDVRRNGWWFGDVGAHVPENNDVRILALCFMAAITSRRR